MGRLTDVAGARVDTDLVLARRQRDDANAAVARLVAEIDQLRNALAIVDAVEGASLAPPAWLAPTAPSKGKRATLALMLSDLHFDEVVRAEEVGGLNAYDRAIAERRLREWGANAVKLARHYLAGMEYDGVLLMLGGDLFSGDIHDELKETNADTMVGSVLHWSEQVAAAVAMLADEFGKVHVPVVVGNHGRTTRKPRAKLRARTNFDWLLGKMLERHFVTDKRVTFQIPDAADCRFEVYGRGHLLTHGDQVNGGGGIGGIWPPIMRMRARKAQHAMSTGRPFDTMWIGHWHQLIQTPSMVINGSMKGYDEYSAVNSFSYEVPQQALAVITPEHGVTFQCPVFCRAKGEKW